MARGEWGVGSGEWGVGSDRTITFSTLMHETYWLQFKLDSYYQGVCLLGSAHLTGIIRYEFDL